MGVNTTDLNYFSYPSSEKSISPPLVHASLFLLFSLPIIRTYSFYRGLVPVVYVNYGYGEVVCDTGQEVALSVQTKHRQKVVQHCK
jgi:hypothetical protein